MGLAKGLGFGCGDSGAGVPHFVAWSFDGIQACSLSVLVEFLVGRVGDFFTCFCSFLSHLVQV